MEDCWEQSPEARISSGVVASRIQQITISNWSFIYLVFLFSTSFVFFFSKENLFLFSFKKSKRFCKCYVCIV
jgi:hypothetical protein